MNDNWLENEIKREKNISVWDFDDRASYLDEEHRQHCEARELKQKHREEHDKINPRINTEPDTQEFSFNPTIFVGFIMMIFMVIGILAVSSIITGEPSLPLALIPFILFIVISIASTIKTRR